MTEALGQHMEREEAARLMANVPRKQRATVGADRAYDTSGLVAVMRQQGLTAFRSERQDSAQRH